MDDCRGDGSGEGFASMISTIMTTIIIEKIKKYNARDETVAATTATTELGCCTRTEPVRDRYTVCVTKKGTTYYCVSAATAAKGFEDGGRGKKLKKLKYSYMG